MYPIHKIVHLLFFCLIINLLKSINYLVRNGYHILILMLIRLFTKFIFVLISFYPSFPIWYIYNAKYIFTSIWTLFYVLLSLNIGCSMMDILYLKILLFSNDGHYVEEHQSGLHILNKVDNPYIQH